MPQRREVVLDSSVIGTLAGAPPDSQGAAIARLRVVRAKTSTALVITPTILGELAATYARQPVFESLVTTLTQVCDGVLDTDGPELLRIELEHPQPYDAIVSRPLIAVTRAAIEETVKEPEVQAFYAAGGFGSNQMKGLLANLDPLRKLVRGRLESFPEYVEARRTQWLAGLLEDLRKRGAIPNKAWDPEDVWRRGAAWRLSSIVYLANEYRRLAQAQLRGKGAGSLSDLRIVIEAAYSHEVVTADKEFLACGKAANGLVKHPRFTAW
jgi:hypothetical protein